MYGLFINVNEVQITNSEDFVHTALMFLLVIGGIIVVILRVWPCFCGGLSNGMD